MASEPHTIAQHIAGTVRQLRKERGWSLDRAAGETGVAQLDLPRRGLGRALLYRRAAGPRMGHQPAGRS